MKTILFVCYGSGHVNMVVPVAQATVAAGLAQVKVLALTTAASVVRAAKLEVLQIKDFLQPGNHGDELACEAGRRLMSAMQAVADPDETAAYLGLSYAELEEDVGAEEAARLYTRDGRQAFLPCRLMQRILREVKPDLVVATNSPRAERAAILAAGLLSLPSICLVDLFCRDEVKWIGDPGYADKVCVLNNSVKQLLLSAGRTNDQIVITGNPAFDDLTKPSHLAEGACLRKDRGWDDKHVLLWPTQVEPAYHPFNGTPGDVTLPCRALEAVSAWVLERDDCILCIRPRSDLESVELTNDPRIVVTGQGVKLPALLQAVDLVVTLNSTVGLQGHLAGARLVQVLGSVFDHAMPLKIYGMAEEAVTVDGISDALSRCIQLGRNRPKYFEENATLSVVNVIAQFI